MESSDEDSTMEHESGPSSRGSSVPEDFAVADVQQENELSIRGSSMLGDTAVVSNRRGLRAGSDEAVNPFMFMDMTRELRTMSLRVEREQHGGERRHVLTDMMEEIVRSRTVSGMWNDLVEWVAGRSPLFREEIERARVSLRTIDGSKVWETSRVGAVGKLALLDVRNFLDSYEGRESLCSNGMPELCLIVPAAAVSDRRFRR